MRVLITGGAGFVGRHFTKYYLDQGDDVVCIDPIVPYTGGIDPQAWPLYNPNDYRNFKFHKIDCRHFFEKDPGEFDLVLHLAAMVGGRLMIDYNPLAVAEDLSIDAMFWKWAKETQLKKSIYFSSSASYPISLQTFENHRLLNENDIDFTSTIGVPDMTYGWAKLTGEYLARVAYERHGLNSVVYRPFSGFGEDQDLTYPFTAICKRTLEYTGKDPFIVWGSGNQMRDFVHITDCVRCVIETNNKISDGSAINISSGKLTSFKTFASIVFEQAGKSVKEIIGTSDKPEGVFARGGDVNLQNRLGFSPTFTLEDGIKNTLLYLEGAMARA